jgi:hypothetical protein
LKKSSEYFGILEWPGRPAKTELVPAIRALKPLEKLAAEDLLENFERKEKALPWRYPTAMVE